MEHAVFLATAVERFWLIVLDWAAIMNHTRSHDEVGIETAAAQLDLLDNLSSLLLTHSSKPWTASSNIMSVAIIQASCITFNIQLVAYPALFMSYGSFKSHCCFRMIT